MDGYSSPPGSQARAGLYWRTGGHFKTYKIDGFCSFLANYSIFFSDTFVPLRRVFKTSFEKIKISQIEKFSTQKISNIFFEKKQKIGVFCKNLENFSIVFLVFTFLFRYEKNPSLKKRKKIHFSKKIEKKLKKNNEKSENRCFFKFLENCSKFFLAIFWTFTNYINTFFEKNIKNRKIFQYKNFTFFPKNRQKQCFSPLCSTQYSSLPVNSPLHFSRRCTRRPRLILLYYSVIYQK